MRTTITFQACERLRTLDGVSAVGVFCPPEEHQDTSFSSKDTEQKDWPAVFKAAVEMFRLLDETRVQITMDTHTVVIEAKDGWTIAVAAPLGHAVRKSLRRVCSQTFRKLAAESASGKVVPFPT